MVVLCRTSSIRAVSLARYSATVSGDRASTWPVYVSMASSRPAMSSASFFPSTARMVLYAVRASSKTAQRSALTASRSSSSFVTVRTSGNRARVSGAIL